MPHIATVISLWQLREMEAKANEREEEKSETKSFFGNKFRKWLSMKRALRLVQEEVYPEQIYVPRMQYKVWMTRLGLYS
jgi:hypothetical protein